MRVRILSGNAAGCVTDVPQLEGEVLVQTGYAELVADEPSSVAEVVEPVVPDAPVDTPPTSESPE